jgi:DNA-binding CsgD family transcriptional regulator
MDFEGTIFAEHAGAVLRKTGARNRTELAAQANRVGGVR